MQHVFISYVRENKSEVDKIHQELESHSIEVWRDLQDINPGERWKRQIRKAIREGAFFIACFSQEYHDRDESYMNEELKIAIERLRQLHIDHVWFIPVTLNKCEIPDWDIGGGETLNDLQYVKLYEDWDVGIQSILDFIQPEPPEPTRDGNTSEGGTRQNRNTEFSGNFIGQNDAQNSKRTDWIFEQGNSLLERKEIDKAIEGYSYAIDLNPHRPDVYTKRAAAYHQKGDMGLAITDLNEVIRLKPDDADAYHIRGITYGEKGDMGLAITDLSEVIRLKPDDADAYYNRGTAYCNKGDMGLAITDLSEAIRLKPDFADAYYNRSIARNNRGEVDSVIEDCDAVIKLKPDLAEAYNNRGTL